MGFPTSEVGYTTKDMWGIGFKKKKKTFGDVQKISYWKKYKKSNVQIKQVKTRVDI